LLPRLVSKKIDDHLWRAYLADLNWNDRSLAAMHQPQQSEAIN